ncbi:MAG: hypothetical protein K0V04_27520 [Deltaproteobacteria bacterium]|nr:hypothetical protein [Deltaproteobacteria bacterium]
MVITSLAMMLSASTVLAQPSEEDIGAAAEAFSHGQRAELAHDYARAAEFYELADDLAPRPEPLRSAAKNRLAAGEQATAATRALELQRRYPDSDASRRLAAAILDETAASLTRVRARCDRPCVLSADGQAIADERALSHVFFLDPGEHAVVASFEPGQQHTLPVEGTAGADAELRFVAPVTTSADSEVVPGEVAPDDGRPAKPPPTGVRRLSPVYFAIGAVVTAGLGGATIWSGLDVLDQDRIYNDEPTKARYDQGRSAERRTNLLIGFTAAAGVATGVVAAFTYWKGAKSRRRAAGHRRYRVAVTASGVGVRF